MYDRLVGNDHVKLLFRRLVDTGRVPNSLLLAGPPGVGKRQFAFELAKAMLCREPTGAESCGECPLCRRSEAFTFPKADDRDSHKRVIFSEHPDVATVIPFGRNVLVDAIRDLEREANFLPFEAGSRFFIVDDADRMAPAAANALLKTLEEPPQASHIFLITSRPDSLLSTIRSRCQTVRFARPAPAEIEKFLIEKKYVARPDAALAARLSGGNVELAISMDVEAFRRQRELITDVLGNLLLRENRAALLQKAEELNDAKNKDNFEKYLDILQTAVHDIWLLSLGRGDDALVNFDILDQLRKYAGQAPPSVFAGWMAEIDELRDSLAVNVNRKIATDALFARMAAG